MDFRALLQDELCALFPPEKERRRAEFAGLLRSGVIRKGEEGLFLCLSHSSLAPLKKCLVLKREFSPLAPYELGRSRERGIRSGLFYRLEIGISEAVLEDFGFYDVSVLTGFLKEEVAADFIRGVFELRGYVGDPLRSYQLEIRFPSRAWALLVQETLKARGIPLHCRQVKSEWHLYTKNAETIGLFLGYLGAFRSHLELERLRVEKETVNDLTRWVNYTTSNLERTVRSSLRQREKIRSLPLELLPPRLREIALLRIRYPYASLRELGSYCSPPVSKGEVYRRLKALEEAAERFQEKSM
jgi:DNA-binding transcriptional regulator WhiA